MRPDNSNIPKERYALARLTELAGDPAYALTIYQSLLAESSEGFIFSQELADAVARLGGVVNGN
ncbi:MAG: hypothetical protein ACI9KN_001473 [Gammaproteobacteria bacterium]|jgi:hypothetical protein